MGEPRRSMLGPLLALVAACSSGGAGTGSAKGIGRAANAPRAAPAETRSPPRAPRWTPPSLPRVSGPIVDYALGDTSCVVEASGKLACWGVYPYRDSGGHEPHRDARHVPGIDDAVRLGRYGAGALLVVHRDGGVTRLSDRTRIDGLADMTWFGDGCGLDAKGDVWCVPSGRAARQVGIGDVIDLATGAHHTCYALRNGSVQCEGSNGYGQLGIPGGASQAIADMPTAGPEGFHPVPGIHDAIAVSAGAEHSCALRRSGRVVCWGSGYQGNVGPGAEPGRLVTIPNIDDAKEIASAEGGWTTCVLRAGDRVGCWGVTGGWSRAAGDRVVDFGSVPGAHRLRVSHQAACVIDGDGVVRCVGNWPRHAPVLVGGIEDARQVIANSDQVCVRRATGDVVCWGRFDERTDHGHRPRYELAPVPKLSGAVDLAGGRIPARLVDFCIATVAGTVTCFDDEGGHPLPGFAGAVQLAMGGAHVCARTHAGAVQCWGSNTRYQLGHADTAVRLDASATTVAGLPPVSHVAAGGDATCAIAAGDRRVWCWGEGAMLGDGSAGDANRAAPKAVPGLRAAALGMAFSHACAIDLEGRVRCWGSNLQGRAGAPSSIGDPGYRLELPAPFATPITGASALWVGDVSCARVAGDRTSCWGPHGAAIQRAWNQGHPYPAIQQWPLPSVVSMAACDDYACAVLASGQVVCLGDNDDAVLGVPDFARWTPVVELGAPSAPSSAP